MLRELKIELKNKKLNAYPLNLLALDLNFSNLDTYFKDLYHSVWRISKEQNKPVYNSRQKFLESLAFDEEQNAFHFVHKHNHSSTLMGGSSDEDEHYDPNWKMMSYSIGNKNYSYIVENLQARVFKGIFCNWTHFHNYEDYLFSVSLKDISIEDFNKLFTPDENADFHDSIASKQMMEDVSKLIKDSIFIEEKEAFSKYTNTMTNIYSAHDLPYEDKVNICVGKQFIDSKDVNTNHYPLKNFNSIPIKKGNSIQMSNGKFEEVKSISLHKGDSYREHEGYHYNITF